MCVTSTISDKTITRSVPLTRAFTSRGTPSVTNGNVDRKRVTDRRHRRDIVGQVRVCDAVATV